MLGTNAKNESPQKDVKRMLPSSLQPSSSSFIPSVPVKDVTSSQIHGNNVKPYSLRGSRYDVAMKNDYGSRLLPPSMNASMSVSSTKVVGQSDRYRPEVVQEEVGDERLIYQVAVQNLNQPIVEATLPDGLLSVSLFRHQVFYAPNVFFIVISYLWFCVLPFILFSENCIGLDA